MKFSIDYRPYEDELLLKMLEQDEIGVLLGRASALLLHAVAGLDSVIKLIPVDSEGNPHSIIFSAAGPPEYILELNQAIMAVADKWAQNSLPSGDDDDEDYEQV